MRWIVLLALASVADAQTWVTCPAHGHFSVVYAASVAVEPSRYSACSYDTLPALSGDWVLCGCPASKTLASCEASLVPLADGSFLGLCSKTDTSGHRQVTWQGRVR